jgi:ABC-type multidrug transport system fused ATPase/permease subunit
MQGRTSILVSHRVSTVRHADKIIVLQNGSIAEEGTHQALIDKKGIYFDLYRKQLLEDEKIV